MTYEQLGELAKQVVIKVMQEGEITHPENDFMERDVLDHHCHLGEHVENVSKIILTATKNEDSKFIYEITHIMARAVIILAKLEQNQENPQN